MKKINLRGILNPMSDSEMKLVKGGVNKIQLATGHENDPPVDGGESDGWCLTQPTLTGPTTCVPNAATAEYYAGKDGWWCCNCVEAIVKCCDYSNFGNCLP